MRSISENQLSRNVKNCSKESASMITRRHREANEILGMNLSEHEHLTKVSQNATWL
jgi:cell division septum initiation protein DivIVA